MATRGLLGIGQELGFEPLLGTVYVCVCGGLLAPGLWREAPGSQLT